MRRSITTALLLLPLAAAAQQFGGNSNSSANAFSNSRSNAYSASRSVSTQRQSQGFVGMNGQSLSGVGAGNSTIVGGSSYDASSIPPIAPNVYPGNATAPCIVTYGASGGLAAVSVGMSGFTRDSVCTWGEVARVARESNRMDVADQALMLMFYEAEKQTGTVKSVNAKEAEKQKTTSVSSSDDGFDSLDALTSE